MNAKNLNNKIAGNFIDYIEESILKFKCKTVTSSNKMSNQWKLIKTLVWILKRKAEMNIEYYKARMYGCKGSMRE